MQIYFREITLRDPVRHLIHVRRPSLNSQNFHFKNKVKNSNNVILITIIAIITITILKIFKIMITVMMKL